MPASVSVIEISYIILSLIFLFLFKTQKGGWAESLYVVLVITSPYSISIIPFRQDAIDFYGIYDNTRVLNVLNFYKIYGLSILDCFSIFILAKNVKLITNKMPFFFIIIYYIVVIFSLISYSISSLVIWSEELDDYHRFLSVFKSLVYILSLYCCFIKLGQRMGLDQLCQLLCLIIIIYFFSNAVFLSFLPQWYTWIKYGFNYKFLDQTDQFLVFLVLAISFFGPLKSRWLYMVGALFLAGLIIISGGKAFVYTLFILAISYFIMKNWISLRQSIILFMSGIVFSWVVTLWIGSSMLDLSIYTRYFQVEQLVLNYINYPVLSLFGIGANKAYYFFSEQLVFDPGAYFSEELETNFRLGFQTPYLLWLKNYGMFGLLIVAMSLLLLANEENKNKVVSKAFFVALSFYFILIVIFDYPSFGIKTFIPVALYMYIFKLNREHESESVF